MKTEVSRILPGKVYLLIKRDTETWGLMLLDIVWSDQDSWNFGGYLEIMASNPNITEQKDERNMNA